MQQSRGRMSGELVKKDSWDKAQVVGAILGSIAAPIVVILLGSLFAWSMKEGETKARLVEVAVDVLKTDPKTTQSIPGLRDWAVDVINSYSPKPLPARSARELINSPLPGVSHIIHFANHGPDEKQCCVTCGDLMTCGASVTTSCGS
jgi:hypothetical protein